MMKIIIILLALMSSGYSYAWTGAGNTKVIAVALWESSTTNPLYFKRADNVWCYVPASEKTLHSLILTLYVSGKLADIHCYDLAETQMGGMDPAHKLHRIIAK
jgi:hypothetical protein